MPHARDNPVQRRHRNSVRRPGRLWYLWNNDGSPAWYSSLVAPTGFVSASSSPAITRSFAATEITAAASDGSLWFYWNNDGSPAWYSSRVAGPGSEAAGFSPAITRTSDGTLIASTFLFQGGILFGNYYRDEVFENTDGSPTWQAQIVYGSDNGLNPAIVPTSDGAVLASTTALPYASVQIWRNLSGSGSWNPEQVSGPGTAYGSPAITKSSSATEVTAAGSRGSLWFYWSADGSSTWHTEQRANDGSVLSVPAITRSAGATEIAVLGP